MIKRALMLAAAVLVASCNQGPSQTADNAVGGATIVSTTQTPMSKATTTLSLDMGKKLQPGQVAIADVLSYGGPSVTITPPASWQLIRNDSTSTTRQSLYWHAIQANDAGAAAWTFSQSVDAQGAIVLLDNVATSGPVDVTTGNTGTGGTVTAKPIVTTADGDLILSFFATDFGNPWLLGSNPQMPADVKFVMNQQGTPREYWILQSYQSQNGSTADQVFNAAQIFNWVTAQVGIKRNASAS
jgi:hypothetical protein